MHRHQPNRHSTEKTEIPDKLYFRIGEVSRLCSVESYVLRFWETEFSQLRPNKSGTGQRLYRKRDVEIALRIKRLLHAEGYTIAGARQILQSETRHKGGQPELPLPAATFAFKPQEAGSLVTDAATAQSRQQSVVQVEGLRRQLRELLGILSAPTAAPEQRPRHGKRFEAPATNLFET